MATTKKFEVAGYSTLNGKTKLRFANDIMRIKILNKRGHTDVELISLPYAMSKAEIAEYMLTNSLGVDVPAVLAAIKYTQKKNPTAAVKAPTAAVKAPVLA
jgi:hypothetical protein